MSISMTSIITVAVLVLILILGFVLSKVGRPYNQILFNSHKIIALGLVIYSIINLRKLTEDMDLSTMIVVLISVAIICLISLFATGAMLSIGKISQELLKRIHNSSTVIFVISVVTIIFEISNK